VGLERVYLDAWSCAVPGAPAYREFAVHWTAPRFDAYVEALEGDADDALGEATDERPTPFSHRSSMRSVASGIWPGRA
jgi:hypothetical protein